MYTPIFSRHLKRPRQSQKRRSVSELHQLYEQLKAQLTASAQTSVEYEAAVREAARRAGV